MTPREAIDICNGTKLSPAFKLREAWQLLHDTKIAYNLPGFYAARARELLAAGMIVANKEEEADADRT